MDFESLTTHQLELLWAIQENHSPLDEEMARLVHAIKQESRPPYAQEQQPGDTPTILEETGGDACPTT